MERAAGIEPATFSLEGCGSTAELCPLFSSRVWWYPRGDSNSQKPIPENGASANSATGALVLDAWCARPDSNGHVLQRQALNLVRLPVPPRAHSGGFGGSSWSRTKWCPEGERGYSPPQSPMLLTIQNRR